MKQDVFAHRPDTEFGKVATVIRKIEIALLTTVDRQGQLHTRPLQTLEVSDDRILWFFTDSRSEKVFELARDVRLSLGYADVAKRTFVTLSGTGRLVHDPNKARELWSSEQRAFYPAGPNDRHLALLRVEVKRAEYWLSPGRSARLLAALKARLTGRSIGIVGKNSKVR